MIKQKLYSLEIIKAIGIILVINSHLDNLYQIPFIGTGGSLGNSLFFLASGIGLGYGWAFHGPLPFTVWFQRRLLRIYPSLTILNLFASAFTIELLIQRSFAENLRFFVYPTDYFFIAAIILFYIPAYFILLSDSTKVILYALLASFIVYATWYTQLDLTGFIIEGGGYFRWVYYFIVFLIGLLYARLKCCSNLSSSNFNWLLALQALVNRNIFRALLISSFSVLLAKVLFNLNYTHLMKFQFLIHIATFLLTFFLFKTSDLVSEKVRNSRLAFPIVSMLSVATLELYLIDGYSIFYIGPANHIINVIAPAASLQVLLRLLAVALYWLVLLVSATALSKISNYTVKVFLGR